MNKAVFLDRDGVVNHSLVIEGRPYSPKSLKELKIVKNCKKLLNELKIRGYILIVVTNQPDIARGKMDINNLIEINNHLLNRLPIDEIIICTHDDHDLCECRKPKPGMIINAKNKFSIDLNKSFLIGDRRSDIECAKNAGVSSIFIDNEYIEEKPANTKFVKNLKEAVNLIIYKTE